MTLAQCNRLPPACGGGSTSRRACSEVSLVARQFDPVFLHDRNDIAKFQRLGDLNQERACRLVQLQGDWHELMPGLRASVRPVAFRNTVLGLLVFWGSAEVAERGRRTRDRKSYALAFVESALTGREGLLGLAAQVAERQASRTESDIGSWIRQLVDNTKDAND